MQTKDLPTRVRDLTAPHRTMSLDWSLNAHRIASAILDQSWMLYVHLDENGMTDTAVYAWTYTGLDAQRRPATLGHPSLSAALVDLGYEAWNS